VGFIESIETVSVRAGQQFAGRSCAWSKEPTA